MSSLAIRFDDSFDDGYELSSPPSSSLSANSHRRHRSVNSPPHPHPHSHSPSSSSTALPSSLAVLKNRKRSEAKKREWLAMTALFSKAMEDKATSKEQQQWFTARFNYPIIHQPVEGGSGALPSNVARMIANAGNPSHPPSASASTSNLHLQPSSSQSNLNPHPHHAHLLHTANAQVASSHPNMTIAESNSSRRIDVSSNGRVAEEAEGEEQDDL